MNKPEPLRCDFPLLRKQRLLIDTLAMNTRKSGKQDDLEGLAQFLSMICAGLERGDVTIYKAGI